MRLKEYQERSLEALRAYFAECVRVGDADTAFYSLTRQIFSLGIPYKPVKELPGLPYVCLRIPTGGGKTLVACHAVGAAARDLLRADSPMVLWLVPSSAILEQTISALKDRHHPYRLALESAVGSVNVLDVEAALYVRRADLDGSATIIVSTMQSFRVGDIVGRRVYRDSGQLMDHFSGLSDEQLSKLEKGEGDYLLHSLANVLRLRRPIIIVDEAHNARTDLSFETLARFDPSCIIEFTATPAREHNPSNVLHTVSAAELKAESMIKMPIRLVTRLDWKELLADAIARRNNLELIANRERQVTGEYIRPLMLIQAQPHRQDQESISFEVVLETLQQDYNIPKEQIAIATGTKNELDGVDIYNPGCPIRYAITVQALREGWDCHFAYVLCSLAEVRSTTYVEQILGRILRLPKASWKKQEDLNMAYAFSASKHFQEAANALTDALIQNGFERQEAKDLIVPMPDLYPQLPFDKPAVEVVTVDISEVPQIQDIPSALGNKVIFNVEEMKMTYQGVMTRDEREELKSQFSTPSGKAAVEKVYRISNGLSLEDKGTPSERGEPFNVPFLAIKQGKLFEPFEETHFLDFEWVLSKCDALLKEEEYLAARPTAQQGEIDITTNGRIVAEFISSLQRQMTLYATGDEVTVANLVYWLDRKISHPDISPTETGIFLTRLVQTLINQRGMSLGQLIHDKYRLRLAVEEKINMHRQEAHKKTYQMLLDPECATPLVVTPEVCFSFNPRQYPRNTVCSGNYEFKKHYYPEVGDLKDQGKEFECAQYIDTLEGVDFWVRNLSRRQSYSFWLQTSTDKFYPDFVCKLKDGRYLVVEYKGEHLLNEDAREKKALGELWEKRSQGKCLFVMPTARNFEAILQKITVSPSGQQSLFR
jgi:type III restriction enzyme